MLIWAGIQISLYTLISIWIVCLISIDDGIPANGLRILAASLIFSVIVILVHLGVIFGITHQRRGCLLVALIYYYVTFVILCFLLGYSVLSKPTTAIVSVLIFGMINFSLCVKCLTSLITGLHLYVMRKHKLFYASLLEDDEQEDLDEVNICD